MGVWRALLYAVILFVALGIISLIVAAIMKLIFTVVHRKENKSEPNITPQ
jgi:hypothetical protein